MRCAGPFRLGGGSRTIGGTGPYRRSVGRTIIGAETWVHQSKLKLKGFEVFSYCNIIKYYRVH